LGEPPIGGRLYSLRSLSPRARSPPSVTILSRRSTVRTKLLSLRLEEDSGSAGRRTRTRPDGRGALLL